LRIALIAAPFLAVPPVDYGGTELFIAHLAEGLQKLGVEVVVYTIGESTVSTERRWLYRESLWPIKIPERASLREMNHISWAIADAMNESHVMHVQAPQALVFSRIVKRPFVLTLHGPHEPSLSEFYSYFPDVQYVCISQAQCREEAMPNRHTIHHGIDLSLYRLVENKQPYLSFIGRIAPIKGTHIAIDLAQRTGIPLKIAGEVQPIYQQYFDRHVRPQLDGKLVEYIGPADLKAKNELLGNSMAMLFPIQWNEPFGLAMVEAMACGTPVVAMPGGSVPEVVREGISGHICRNVREMARTVLNLNFKPAAVRAYAEQHFSIEKMASHYAALYQDILGRRTHTLRHAS